MNVEQHQAASTLRPSQPTYAMSTHHCFHAANFSELRLPICRLTVANFPNSMASYLLNKLRIFWRYLKYERLSLCVSIVQ